MTSVATKTSATPADVSLAQHYPPAWATALRATGPLIVSIFLAYVLHAFVAPRVGGFGSNLILFACVIAGLIAAAAGWLVGLPSLRLRGDYLAIVTLGFGEIVRVILQGTAEQQMAFTAQAAEPIRNTPVWRLAGQLGGAKGFN